MCACERESERQSNLVLLKVPVFVSDLKHNRNNNLTTVLEHVETRSIRSQV